MIWNHRGCICATWLSFGLLAGCNDRPAPKLSLVPEPSPTASVPEPAKPPAAAKATTGPLTPTEIDPAATNPKGHATQWWEAVYAAGTKIGWGHTAITNFEEDGRKLAEIDSRNFIAVDREGQRTTIEIGTRSVETPEGELLRFRTEMNSGPSRTLMKGAVVEGKLTIETSTSGKTTTDTLPWLPGTLGFNATEQSLAAAPLLPGQRRTLRALMPATNEVVTIELAADKFEPTTLLDHSEDLLRIESMFTLPVRGQADKLPVIRSQLWTNREGIVMKTAIAALRQETYRTSREIALADSGPRRLDLVIDNTVPVARSIDRPHDSRRVRYRVQLASDDPAKVFFAGPLQELLPLDPHTAEIVVRRFVPGATNSPAAPGSAVRPPTAEDRAANNLIQSDNPQIVALAQSVSPNEDDSWTLAVALEKFVKAAVTLKGFSQAFATAAEVAQQREGDCTEHAVLLAALARARGIPARVAIGLVYQSATRSFVYHMWNELWIGDRWVPLDATLGCGGIGADHLKLTDSNLAGAQAYSSFLPVAQVIGQLKIEILEVE